MRYHGGKWRLAPWIISHFPPHRAYIEPFGGAASVLMRKPRSYAEIYNDLDSEIVNVFHALRDKDSARELERLIRLTPFARDDFEAAYTPSDDPVEQARRTLIKSYAGHGSDSIHRGKPSDLGMFTRISKWKPTTGFRSNSNRSGTTPAHDWRNYPDVIAAFCERLQGVVVENRPAIQVIQQYDHHDALIYVDPPYVRSSRRSYDHGYRHDFADEDHLELAKAIQAVEGMVVLSGYHSEMYDDLYGGWRHLEKGVRTFNNKGINAVEVLWFSPNIPARQVELF